MISRGNWARIVSKVKLSEGVSTYRETTLTNHSDTILSAKGFDKPTQNKT